MKVEELLELVSNPEKYQKALKELDDKRKSVEDSLKVYGEASQIPVLKEKAERELAKARDEAAKILAEAADAAGKARKAVSDAADKVAKKEEQAVRKESLAEENIKHAKEMVAEAEKVRKEAQKTVDHYTALITAVQAKEAEVEARLAKLRSVMQ